MEIHSKQELLRVLNYERLRWRRSPVRSKWEWIKLEIHFWLDLGNPYWYMYCLRNYEYYSNFRGISGGVKTIIRRCYGHKLKVLAYRTGIELDPGQAELGVTLNHGRCIISKVAKIGRDCVIVGDVTIGGVGGKRDISGAAKIGNRVFISTGVRIIGPVHIADNVVIGAKAVVVKDVTEPGITIAGVPARKIKDEGSENYIREIDPSILA